MKLLGLARGITKKRGNKKSDETNPLQRQSHVLVVSRPIIIIQICDRLWENRPIGADIGIEQKPDL